MYKKTLIFKDKHHYIRFMNKIRKINDARYDKSAYLSTQINIDTAVSRIKDIYKNFENTTDAFGRAYESGDANTTNGLQAKIIKQATLLADYADKLKAASQAFIKNINAL